jgi:glycosyltransferase involved in cell wall biosynthesis
MPIVWQVVPDAHLLIAGARTMFAARLEQLIQSWSKEEQDKIKLHYNFSNEEKPALFAAVDVFAYPSGYESFGIAFLEAWAASKPVIGCRRGAVPWVINAGNDGLLVDYQSEQMLAEAIIMLLKNPAWAKGLGEVGHKKVLSDYTWTKVAQKIREIYVNAREKPLIYQSLT